MLSSRTLGALSTVTRGPEKAEPSIRELLEFLQQAAGLDSTYLTVIHWEDLEQEILVSHNAGDLDITEGLVVEWTDTLCRRVLMGAPSATDDVPGTYGDSVAAQDLRLVSYASVPVTLADGSIYGTLCGVSTGAVDLDDQVLALFEAAAGIVSAQLDRERRRAKERQRLFALEEQFRAHLLKLAGIEHKLKTPLAVITGWASTLQDRELSEQDRLAGQEAIGRHAARLRSLVDDLLTAAREGHASPPELRAMDLAPVLTAVAADLERTASERNWSATVIGPLLANADPVLLEQAVGHLVENAVKYTKTGDSVAVTAERHGDVISITVTDSGSGLPEDASQLFDPFIRVGPERTDSVGLGLYIVRTIVEQHGGEASATNRPGGGAAFEIRLPALA